MNHRAVTIALATAFLLMAVLVIWGNRSRPEAKNENSAQISEDPGHRNSNQGAAANSGSEGGHSQNLRRHGDRNAGFKKTKKKPAYHGPSSLDGWQQTVEDAWQYESQSLISQKSGSIAHDEILPDECSISFTVERKSDQIDLKLMIFSDDTESSRPRSGYELSFQRSSIYLRSGKTRNFLGSDHSREISQNGSARIEIRASRNTGEIVLLINGEISDVWRDPGVQENAFGKALHFVAGTNQKVRISDIKIDSWDPGSDVALKPNEDAENASATPTLWNFHENL